MSTSEEEGRDKKFVTLSEAAKINNVTRQAIYVAIKQKKLKAYKNPTRWIIDLDDLEDYRNMKYSRTKSVHNGELLYDNGKGFYSIQQASKMLNIPYQKVYYATRIGLMKAVRKGSAWVIHIDDIKNYQNTYLNRLISNLDSGAISS
jgi:excisionase family DNA binding protein